MPRPKKAGGPEPKRRSRHGCWPCKSKKVKCGEEKPRCLNCERAAQDCDYSIRLNWEGRSKRKTIEPTFQFASQGTMSSSFSLNEQQSPSGMGNPGAGAFIDNVPGSTKSLQRVQQAASPADSPHTVSMSNIAVPYSLWIPASNSASLFDGTASASDSTQNRPGPLSHTRLPRLKEMSVSSYPSPAGSDALSRPHSDSPDHPDPQQLFRSTQMLPPFQPTSYPHSRLMPPLNSRTKRPRLGSEYDISVDPWCNHPSIPRQSISNNTSLRPTSFLPAPSRAHSPPNTACDLPATPSASSVASEDQIMRPLTSTTPIADLGLEDPRRLSVNSLLSSPIKEQDGSNRPGSWGNYSSTGNNLSPQHVFYGIDRGLSDFDLPRNNDKHALDVVTPPLGGVEFFESGDAGTAANEFGFGLYKTNTAHSRRGYYSNPVPVLIPRSLEPLPSMLLENPMNTLYFHHFLNHTAAILVPHDCSQNPFKIILPQMAVRDSNLMNLLLAYSASHRARLLKHPEPANRIAVWVRDVFPTLRHALEAADGPMSSSNLATAIMLASLEIVSPDTFEVSVSWQTHLNIARKMIVARGGPRFTHERDKVSCFLSRWFAYLDVLGSLSGGKNDQLISSGDYWTRDNELDEENDFQIDCLLGFTSRCVCILAKIAELARVCDTERIDASRNIDPAWRPPPDVVTAAKKLRSDLQIARTHRYKGCPHRQAASENEDGWDAIEMAATNEAFHWAGLIHLDRRILAKASADSEVQDAVRHVVGTLFKIQKGGTAEACLLFPIFTAGCDAREPSQREIILARLHSVEGSGMTQAKKARRLMERVWETGKPWETLVQGEFFG